MGCRDDRPISVCKTTHFDSPLAASSRRSELPMLDSLLNSPGAHPTVPSRRALRKWRKLLALQEEGAHTCGSLGGRPETVRGEADRWTHPMPIGMRGRAPAGISMKPAASLARRFQLGRQTRPAMRGTSPAGRNSVETGSGRAVSDLTRDLTQGSAKHHWPENRKVSS